MRVYCLQMQVNATYCYIITSIKMAFECSGESIAHGTPDECSVEKYLEGESKAEFHQPGGGDQDWRPLRSRSFLSDEQVGHLHTRFRRNPFPSKYELSEMAEQIGVNKRVVQVWFQVRKIEIFSQGIRSLL